MAMTNDNDNDNDKDGGKILDFMRRNQTRGEGGRGTMDCPNKKRGNRQVSREGHALPHQWT